MQGVFVIEYGDPATNRERGSVRYLLAGDQGNVTVLLVEPHLLDELGPPTALHGRRVSITANSSGKDTLQVCTLRFAAEARSR